MKIQFTATAVKSIQKLSPKDKLRVKKKLAWFMAQKNPLHFAEPLMEFRLGQYRFRIGDFRVIFDIIEDTAVVHLMGHRKEIYR